jgi:hypothetical protein
VERDMENRLRKKAKQMYEANRPPTIREEEEGEALGASARGLARWASQIPPSENPTILPFPQCSSISPPPLPLWQFKKL